jgi:hypothetical protein
MSAAFFHNSQGGRPSPGPTWRGSLALPREQHEAVEQIVRRAKPRFWKAHRLSLPKSTALAVMAELFLLAAPRVTQADVSQLPVHHQAPGAFVLEAAQARARGDIAPPPPAVELVPDPAQLAFDFSSPAPSSPNEPTKEPTVKEPDEAKARPAPLRLVPHATRPGPRSHSSATPTTAPTTRPVVAAPLAVPSPTQHPRPSQPAPTPAHGPKPAPPAAPKTTPTQEPAPTARGSWQKLRERLREVVGASHFETWLSRVSPERGEAGHLVLACPNDFYRANLEECFRAVIEHEAAGLAGYPVRVSFVVAARQSASPSPTNPAPEPKKRSPQQEAYAELEERLEDARNHYGGISYKLQDSIVDEWRARWREKGVSVSAPVGHGRRP